MLAIATDELFPEIRERIRAADAERIASIKRLHSWLDRTDEQIAADEIAWQAAADAEHAEWLASGEPDPMPALLAAWQAKQKAKIDAAEKEYDAICNAGRKVRMSATSTDAECDAADAMEESELAKWHRKHAHLFPSRTKEPAMSVVAFPMPTGHPTGSAPDRLRERRVDVATLDGVPVPEREWLVPRLIPAENVTLLYGDGGTGKSLIALQLAVAVATGTTWLGRPVAAHDNVEFVTAEDSQSETHRRLTDVARLAGVRLADIDGLHVTSLADEDAILAAPEDGRGGALVATALYAELDDVLADARPALLVLDTLADVYGGNEIVRAQVRQFVGMLRRLALRHGVTVVVLAHPSLAGMDRGTSGSTGWSNSVRSRLYFQRVYESDGSEADEDARVLRVGKSNYGRVGEEIRVRWHHGVFVPEKAAGGDPLAQHAKIDHVFMALLNKFNLQERVVSVAPGHNYAPKLFEADARALGVGKKALAAAMNRLLDSGRIQNVAYGPPSRSTKRLVSRGVSNV